MNLKLSRIFPVCCFGNGLVRSLFSAAGIVLAAGLSPSLAAVTIYESGDYRGTPISTGPAGNVEELRLDSGYAMQAGEITGAGGVLKTGAGELELMASDNTFSGGLTIAGGMISFYQGYPRADGPLGAEGGAITLDGGMLYSGHYLTLDPSRPVILGANGGALTGNLIINQSIAGTGALTIGNSRSMSMITLGGLQDLPDVTTVNKSMLMITGTFINAGGIILVNDGYLGIGESAGAVDAWVGGVVDATEGSIDVLGNSILDAAVVLGLDGASTPRRTLVFKNNSFAANSEINVCSNGLVQFWNSASPGSAIINNEGGAIEFLYYAAPVSAAGASIVNNASPYSSRGYVSIETPGGPGDIFEIGYLAGSGNVYVGDATLILGGLDNRDMLISGTISYGNSYGYGGVLGGLTKIGPSTLTLSAANVYYGATTLSAGRCARCSRRHFLQRPRHARCGRHACDRG